MGRTKEFDPDVALRAAMELFWRRGYEATSMQDLVDHLGIGRASIYATFGSKHELYLSALDRYCEGMDGTTLAALSQSGPALPAVRAVLRSFVENALADEERKGCMVTNTAVECLPHDQQAARRVDASHDAIETALTGGLIRAQSQGELAGDRDPRAIARFLVTFLQGLQVIARTGNRRRLTDAVEQALTLLN
ncbi:TetR/AcrR family transcriptional regulator [Allokutzneria sp. A3M-2-11 16]|uniref:TetR/AcrR family transcriptional regulator n=1 Tax=Allokutzneria sp. A3M-2-11 16 TaxID=2962043 RepID=UPI0020B7B526|nr:TetR/AcrR family transcriptional regulator [Allokutzneria sp. A3M-2-11 16]MCP3804949.1 TetR/AcrR family transcriptional regulator [Allokutzneria sp. A3M-2-11 16]